MYPNGEIELIPVETGNLLQVTTGKTSACIQGAAASSVEIKDNDLPLEIVGDAIYLEEDAYLFAKTERGDALRAKVDAALTEMHEDGTLTELSNKMCIRDSCRISSPPPRRRRWKLGRKLSSPLPWER